MHTSTHHALNAIRAQKPLILNLTNHVTMDLMANALLALGAAPIMSICQEEIEELVALSHAININLGTLTPDFVRLCLFAADCAKKANKPIILDPVGAGATQLRTQSAMQFLPYATIVKGNASEILALGSALQHTLGVESVHQTLAAKEVALSLAQRYQSVVVVTGNEDLVCDSAECALIQGGHPLMAKVTGMGCTLGAIIAAFHAVEPSPLTSAACASRYVGQCAEIAAQTATGSGSFRTAFIDALGAS